MRLGRLTRAALALLAVGGCADRLSEIDAAPRIPSVMVARWGLTEADCSADPQMAAAIMNVGESTLKFPRSLAKMSRAIAIGSDRVEAEFDFIGVEAAQRRHIVLEMGETRETLYRHEIGEALPAASYVYMRCD